MKKNKGLVAANAAARNDNPIAALITHLNKTIGPGTIMVGEEQVPNVDFISTGIATLDAVMGGGVPRGRIIEVFGAEGSGKTTTTLEMLASCQRTYFEKLGRHGVCAFIDAEHSLDPTWARKIGVDMDAVLLNQPASGEEAFQVAEEVVKSGLIDLVVIDSVAALVPKGVLDGSIEDNRIGAQAQLMSKGLARLKGYVNNSKSVVIFINQLRQKIGVMYGSPDTTPGGLALKYYSSIRVDLRRGETHKLGTGESAKPAGVVCRAKVIKNKVAPPFRNCSYSIYFGLPVAAGGEPVYGVDKVGCLFDAALAHEVITQSSSFYYFDSNKIGNGRDKSVAALVTDADLADRVRAAVMAAVGPVAGVDLAMVDDDELDEALGDGGEGDGGEDKEEDLTTSVVG